MCSPSQPSASPTQTTTSYNGISAYAQPYVNNLLGQAQALTSNPQMPLYQGQRTADFTGLQNQAFNSANNLQTPGGYQQGSNLNQAAGIGALSLGNQAVNLGMSATPQDFQQQVGGYMNPYVQNSLNPQLQLLGQQTGINSAAQQAAATSAGAFGGSRSALANALQQQNGQMAAQNAIAQGYNTAFNNAQNQYNQNGAFQMQGLGLGLQGAQAAQSAGTNLANIAGNQLGAQQNIINQQASLGAQQQQQQQNVLNQQYQDFLNQQQYPYQQLSYMQNILSGLPLSSTTQNVYSNPSLLSQVAGLGTTAYALNKMSGAKGGLPKDFKKDRRPAGLAELALHKMA